MVGTMREEEGDKGKVSGVVRRWVRRWVRREYEGDKGWD